MKFGYVKELGLDTSKVNPRGAITLGHPIGAVGTRVLVTLLHHFETTAYIASLCIVGGMDVTMVIERL